MFKFVTVFYAIDFSFFTGGNGYGKDHYGGRSYKSFRGLGKHNLDTYCIILELIFKISEMQAL